MGIQGLLQALKPYSEHVHVKKYSGQRVGIDAYLWLHKGAYACGMELQLEGTKRRKVPVYVSYCMHRIKMLKYNKVIPVVVFDGGPLPMKAATQQERRRRRETNLENAQKKHAEGDMLGAQELFQRAVDVTPAMAHELVKVLREEGVEFVVAPYEADAQLAYLAGLPGQKGGIAAVISEDSDLLAYGCKAVLFKMDRYGQCEEICLPKVFECDPPPLKAIAFKGFTQDLFLGMCVMAGCDFLASIPGIGVKRAHVLLAKYRNISRVLSKLKLERSTTFPENYLAEFMQAKAIFNHARVYDREKRGLVLLNPLPEELLEEFASDLDFLGPDFPQSRAKAIAEGRLDPITMEAFNSVVSPKTPAWSGVANKESGKNLALTLSPIRPFPMYSSSKKSPKVSKSASFFSSKWSNPAPSPASPFTMFSSRKEMLSVLDSPPMQALHVPVRSESLKFLESKAGDTEIMLSRDFPSEVSRPREASDDFSDASQVTVIYERRLSETKASMSGSRTNDAIEMDQTFLAQLKFAAGCGIEVPTQTSATGYSSAISSGHENAPNNPFKRKKVEILHLTPDDSTGCSGEIESDAEENPSTCLSAEERSLTRVRKTPGDDCRIIPPELVPRSFPAAVSSADLASQTDRVGGHSADAENGSSSSVLTEISPNFQHVEESSYVNASPSTSSPRPARGAGVNIAINGRLAKSQNDRSRVGRRLKAQNASPATPPGGGILKFFKPVSQ